VKKQHPLTEDEFKQDYIDKYFRAKSLLDADDLTVVVRAHLLIEILIEILLKKELLKSDILADKDFTFYMKLMIADSMGLIPSKLLPAIKKLNNIRNEFVHNINTSLQNLDIRELTELLDVKDSSRKINEQYKNNNKLLLGLAVWYLLGYLSVPVFSHKIGSGSI